MSKNTMRKEKANKTTTKTKGNFERPFDSVNEIIR